MKSRLLYLTGDLGPGGLQRQLCYLLEHMDRERYRPSVAVWRYRKEEVYVQKFRDLGIPIYPMPQNGGALQKLMAFRKLANELQPEVIHSYCFHTNIAVMWASIVRKFYQVGSIRNDFDFELGIGKVLGRVNARWPRTQICNSFTAAKMIKKKSSWFKPNSYHIVRNGLDVNYFPFAQELPEYPQLLAVGRLSPEKRWDRLLKSVESLRDCQIPFKVCLAGVGPLQDFLKSQAEKLNIKKIMTFLGYQQDIPFLLGNSSFLVHTAEHEGSPNVVMEAMACGRAVVATDAGDVPYLIENGKTGFVVPRGNQKRLTECIRTLMKSPELCQRMGKAGRAKAEKEFGMEHLVSETLNVYRTMGWKS